MKNVDLMVENCCIVTVDKERRILQKASLLVDAGLIKAVLPTDEAKNAYSAKQTIDGTDKILFPGFVNTHGHLFQVLIKGLGRDMDLLSWLDNSVRPAISQMGPQDAYLAAKVGLMEQISSGVSTSLDYQYAHGVEGIDAAVLNAMQETGVRGILARGYSNSSGFSVKRRFQLNETEDDMLNCAQGLWQEYKGHPRISIQMAPGIIWAFSESGFLRMRKIADETKMRITMHTVETQLDNEFCIKEHGKRVFPYLESLGILGPDLLAVHCVDMDDEDLRLFAKYDVKVSYNPLSNMIMGYGVAPIVKMQEMGITVSVALDGAGSNDNQNMLEVLKATALLQKTTHKDPSVMPAAKVLEMATIGGAKAVGMEDSIGSIEVGKKADFFLFNPLHLNSVPVADPVAALVYTGCEHNVCLTAVGGQIVYKDGTFPGIDTEKTLRELQKVSVRIREKTGLSATQWGRPVSMGDFEDKRG